MGFHLSGLFQNTASEAERGTQAASGKEVPYRIAPEIKNLLPGQTISGEVVAIRDGEVDIAIAKNQFMTAKLERDFGITIGQMMSFEIKSNSSSQMTLRPLFANLEPNPNVWKAITAAHIPLNETTIRMVTSMMEEGLPIDKQSLQAMYRLLNANPETQTSTLVQMTRLQIPVTAENIAQFENYKNFEHSILKSGETIADQVYTSLSEMAGQGEMKEAQAFYGKLMQIFAGPETGNLSGNTGEVLLKQEEGGIQSENQDSASQRQPLSEIGVPSSGSAGNPAQAMEALAGTEKAPSTVETAEHGQVRLGDIVDENSRTELVKQLSQLGVSEKYLVLIQEGTMTPKAMLTLINGLMGQGDASIQGAVKELIGSKAFENILKAQITAQWTLEPAQVAESGRVDELYAKLQQQTAKLAEALSGAGKENSPLAKTATTLMDNLEFMNHLNQAFTYVQLPLKMRQNKAHGDLYIYTNKKNLAKKDGNVSALLHLEMEHIGTLDVYVSMQNHKVNTKFYLEKEEYLDVVADQLPRLSGRLEKRGYSITTEVALREKKVNVVEEMLEQNQPAGSLSKFSFDVRA